VEREPRRRWILNVRSWRFDSFAPKASLVLQRVTTAQNNSGRICSGRCHETPLKAPREIQDDNGTTSDTRPTRVTTSSSSSSFSSASSES